MVCKAIAHLVGLGQHLWLLYFIVEPNNTVLYWIAIEVIPKLHVYQQQRNSRHHQYLHGAEAADIPYTRKHLPPTNTHWAGHRLHTR